MRDSDCDENWKKIICLQDAKERSILFELANAHDLINLSCSFVDIKEETSTEGKDEGSFAD